MSSDTEPTNDASQLRAARTDPEAFATYYALPARRRRDFMTPGTVTAWNAAGRVLAERPVAAVAFWHARER